MDFCTYSNKHTHPPPLYIGKSRRKTITIGGGGGGMDVKNGKRKGDQMKADGKRLKKIK